MEHEGAPEVADQATWFNPGVRSIGLASFLSDVGHEIPTSLLPSFLASTLGAPASALGLIEGIADGAAGVAKLAGGAMADDPHRRSRVAVGGYVTTAVLSSCIGLATTPWQVAVLRTGAWTARGIRGPARNAILADVVAREAYGRAYGFERTADNLGAIVGPLLAIPLIALVGVRSAILVSIAPGLLAAVAIARGGPARATSEHREAAADPPPGATRAPRRARPALRGHGGVRVRELRRDPADPAGDRTPRARARPGPGGGRRGVAVRGLQPGRNPREPAGRALGRPSRHSPRAPRRGGRVPGRLPALRGG